jgi:capsid protein
MVATLDNLTFSADTLGSASASGSNRAVSFGYDAVEDKGRRKPPVMRLRSEDDESTPFQRGQQITLTRDLRRNFSIAGWAIRKHLDYVSTFSFQSKIGDKKLDKRIEELVGWWGQARNCDAAGRHGLRRYIRLCEAHRTVDGDIFTILLGNGKAQAVEGDRVRTPMQWPATIQQPPDWLRRMRHGVLLGESGEAQAFAVNKRGGSIPLGPDWMLAANTFTFERLVPARDMIQLGYFDRFDQVRGSSLFLSATNTLRDVYEGFDYALAKAKVAQMIALKMTGFSPENLPETIDWGRGPVSLKLNEGENIELLQGNTPSTEWQAFINFTIAASLKAFDIPFSFYDESHTNYSGSRGAWLQYDVSAEQKRNDLREFMDRLTAWRLGMFIACGTLELPRGFDPAKELRWNWVASRVPWLDPLKEIQAFKLGANAGFDSTIGVATTMGRDAYELADEEARYQKYRESIGLSRTDVPLAPVPVTINEAA